MTSTNPYRNTLRAIAVFGAVAGLVLFLIGMAIDTASGGPSINPLDPQPGALVIGLAGFALWLAVIAFFLWLVVSALLWREPAVGQSAAESPGETVATSGAGKLERIRAALDEQG